ncbi:MAG: alpha/beta hydrolase [Candidatus Fermentibacteraceae bacterium]|nr:alpha/beta hydrolase [Candidatus Fermentibacteraceae bacterium]MBN2608341.1 alpha/beta hydrolase [Candidatus Fermentibacteraceae bacterium]
MKRGSDLVITSCSLLLALNICSAAETGEEDPIHRIQAGDITMGYEVSGDGYPLVLITGFGGTMDMWDPDVVSILSGQYRVIAFDNRGMGETTAGERAFSIEQFADDAAALMDSLGISKAHVLSWSMGTEIALELVLRHPEKVDRLILYAGDYQVEACPPSPEVFQTLTDTSGSAGERGTRMMGLLFPPEWLASNLDRVIGVFSGFTETSSAENIQKQADAMDSWTGAGNRLGLIESPTLLITGTEDVLTPPQNSLMLLEGIPGAQLEQIENGGHGVMYQYPELFAGLVLDFLEQPAH